jgi:membrane-bound metal-dependent hydrolase YbcI (DUF457 family)
MMIAHAPAGYVLATSLLRWLQKTHVSAKAIILVGVIGAVTPDIDMLYFHLIDHRQNHHHKYFTHWPIVWFSLLCMAGLWYRFGKRSKLAVLSLVFSLGGVLHVILDSFVGDVWWLAPFIDQAYALFTVPARFDPWWLNFILHWSFAAELAIIVWAGLIYRRRSKTV